MIDQTDNDNPTASTLANWQREAERIRRLQPKATTLADVAERLAKRPKPDPQRRPFASLDYHG